MDGNIPSTSRLFYKKTDKLIYHIPRMFKTKRSFKGNGWVGVRYSDSSFSQGTSTMTLNDLTLFWNGRHMTYLKLLCNSESKPGIVRRKIIKGEQGWMRLFLRGSILQLQSKPAFFAITLHRDCCAGQYPIFILQYKFSHITIILSYADSCIKLVWFMGYHSYKGIMVC